MFKLGCGCGLGFGLGLGVADLGIGNGAGIAGLLGLSLTAVLGSVLIDLSCEIDACNINSSICC